MERNLPIDRGQPYYMKLLNLIIALLLISVSSNSQTRAEIVSFNTEKVSGAVAITWTPSVEPASNHFEIQRSEDGTNWKVIAIMFPFEDASKIYAYKYNDKSATDGILYYRIRQIDINKKENFSKVNMPGSTNILN